MQISTGLVNVINGSNLVQGNDSVNWTQVTDDSFIIISGQAYDIVSCNALTKEIRISPNYAGATASGVAYAIVQDFTLNHNLPLLNPGDLEAAAIISRAMVKIDEALSSGGGDASLGEILVTKTGHGFLVGNFLTISGSTWVHATSNNSASSIIVGCVKEVVDADHFKIVTQGRITGISGIGLTSGVLYYLRNSLASSHNITSDLSFTNLQVPVLLADSSTSGWILNLARAQTGVFGLDTSGLVPGPNSTDVANNRTLTTAGWADSSLSANSIAVQHLSTASATVDWTNFALKQTGLSILKHILDLNDRVSALYNYSRRIRLVNGARTKLNPGSGSGSFTVPARVACVRLRVISGSVAGYLVQYGYEFLMDVAPGDVISWTVDQTEGYIDEPTFLAANQARVRVYKNAAIAIDIQPYFLGTYVAGDPTMLNPLTFNSTVKYIQELPGSRQPQGLYFQTLQLYNYTYAQINSLFGELVLDDAFSVYKDTLVPSIRTTYTDGSVATARTGATYRYPIFPKGKGLYIKSLAGGLQIEYTD